jgi:SAM-dependent methyltransferase
MAIYTDTIGERLDHPERVPPEHQHLIADDQQRVARILSFTVCGRVLDVGCSDGAITRRIAERWDVKIIGVDMYDGMGGRWATRLHRNMSYERWDVRTRRVDLAGGFDAVYACEVLEHLTDADAATALQNMLAVLRSGGDLIVTVPNRDCAERYVAGCRDRWKWPDHRSVWTANRLFDFLRPHFPCFRNGIRGNIEFVPLYDGERAQESIWLIVRARGKR